MVRIYRRRSTTVIARDENPPLSPINRHRPRGFRRRLSPPRIKRRTHQHPPDDREHRRRTIEHHHHHALVVGRRIGTRGSDNRQPHPRRTLQRHNGIGCAQLIRRPPHPNEREGTECPHHQHQAHTEQHPPTPPSPSPACHHPRTLSRAATHAVHCVEWAQTLPDLIHHQEPNPTHHRARKGPSPDGEGPFWTTQTGKVRPGCCGPDLFDQPVKPIDTTRYSLLLSGRCGRFSPACAAFHS